MKLDKKIWEPMAKVFVIGFLSAAGSAWRDPQLSIWWKIAIPTIIGIVMIPVACLIAIPLVRFFRAVGVMPPAPVPAGSPIHDPDN